MEITAGILIWICCGLIAGIITKNIIQREITLPECVIFMITGPAVLIVYLIVLLFKIF